ncbi:MAG: hypothetical protein JWM53_5949 [bacterium]|nr:hypothetical protein [bacterium]
MPTVEERFHAATAYVRRAIAAVEDKGVVYAIDPVTGFVEWYAGKVKTAQPRNDLARIEARWLRATGDDERTQIARDAELLADRVEENLPGAPQDRIRTNLYAAETPKSTPATSYYGEVANQTDEVWDWVKQRASGAADGVSTVAKALLAGGGIILGWKVFDYLRERQRREQVRAGATERQRLNTNLSRAADAQTTPLRRAMDDTELETWFERDRAHVELRDRLTGQTIVEWWDDEVQQAIEDGFLPERWTKNAAHAAAFEYAEHMGLVEDEDHAP